MSREYVLQPFRREIELKIDYAKELNEQQYAAVTALPGPALVIAGAGSGKTRTLTYRVAYLLEQGIPPDRILLLTFTNKAAREMMRRVNDLLGSDLADLWGGTFHSIGNRILRRNAPRLGFKSDFTILDREDSKDLAQACLDASKTDVTREHFPKADMLVAMFSMAVNIQEPIANVLSHHFSHFQDLAEEIAQLQQSFQERKRANNVMDFDDLLLLWLQLLEQDAEVREQYQRRFQFVLVDEYQDTNTIQSRVIDLLAQKHHNLMVVGDDSQSIYSWRGANFKNIMEFPARYPEAKIYKIEINYRSTPEILNVANACIEHNRDQFEKKLAAHRKPGEKPALVVCGNPGEQAAFVAQRVLELRDQGVSLNGIAVLYRSHFHALELQLELTRRNLPFTITSGIRFFEQAHIKDVTGFIKVLANPADEVSFKRIVRLLPGIGGKSAEKLWTCFDAAYRNEPASAANPLARSLQGCSKNVPKKTITAWAGFTATFAQIEDGSVRDQPAKILRIVLEGFYEDYAEENFPNHAMRLDEVEQLAEFALSFQSTQEFLTQLALLSNLEAEDDKVRGEDQETLKLTTIHQAKGLEFDEVFLIMLCQGLFPSFRSMERPELLEEERRLFYVAVTRARNELYLTYPVTRYSQGSGEMMQLQSQFLGEIPADLLEPWNLRMFEPF